MTVLTNRILYILSLLGVQVAGYLTLAHLNIVALICGKMSGCDKVAHHASSHGFGIPLLAPIPTAAFGLGFYLMMVLLCQARAGARSPLATWGIVALQWGMAFTGVLMSGWLTFLEKYVIHGWCPWCLASAAIILLMFVTITSELILLARPARPEPVAMKLLKPREASRFLVIFLVALLFDSSVTLALRRVPPSTHPSLKLVSVRESALVPRGVPVYGAAMTPYTLVEFGDYACQHCQTSAPDVESFLQHHAASVNFIFHYYPIEEEKDGMPALAARAAQAAGAQQQFWPMHMRLFAQERVSASDNVSLPWVLATADSLGLDHVRLQRDLTSPATLRAIKAQEQQGNKLGIDGVPAFFIIEHSGKTYRFASFPAMLQWFAAHARK